MKFPVLKIWKVEYDDGQGHSSTRQYILVTAYTADNAKSAVQMAVGYNLIIRSAVEVGEA